MVETTRQTEQTGVFFRSPWSRCQLLKTALIRRSVEHWKQATSGWGFEVWD